MKTYMRRHAFGERRLQDNGRETERLTSRCLTRSYSRPRLYERNRPIAAAAEDWR